MDIETVTGSGASPCGPGCRLALERPVNHGGLISHGFSLQAVADTNPEELFYASVGSSSTQVVRERPALAYLEGTLLSYVSVPSWPAGDIMVLDTAAKTRTSYFHFEDGEAYGSPLGTMLSDKYVFWMHEGGTSRANLQTGEITQKFAPSMQCDRGCVAGGKILCLDGDRILSVDQETGNRAYLDDGGALQLNAGCSPDRKRMAWVDFRDAPGRESTYFGAHRGGEIYLYEVASGKVRRLTHDSPESPVTKGFAAVGTDLAVWLEPCPDCPKNFDLSQDYLASLTQLVRLDLTTGRKCRLAGRNIGDALSVHGHHLYGYWTDSVKQYLVDLDLDEPSLAWICE